MMPRRLFLALAPLLAAMGASALWAQATRYEAWTIDGTRSTGAKVAGNHEPAGSPQLDGRTLLTNGGDSTRALHDTALSGELTGPYVQFTNGDILPGRIVALARPNPDQRDSAQVLIEIESGGRNSDLQTGQIAVRESALWRVGVAGQSDSEKPGQVLLDDGRFYSARAIRCTSDGLQCLTADGVVTVSYGQVRAAHWPRRDLAGELLKQNAFAGSSPRAPILRMRMADGAVLTVARSMSRRVSGSRITLRPIWAIDNLQIHRDRIAWHTWWFTHEVPLPLLPVVWKRMPQGLHAWPAKVNASVLGDELRCDTFSADLGLGTHSGTRGTFTLPPNSQRFSGWVGIHRSAGKGGCAIVKVYRDAPTGEPLWQSGFLRGGEAPVRIGPLDLNGAKHLVLVTDWAHAGRPAGADPLDIRDYVDWLEPFVEVDPTALPRPAESLDEWIPELAGWHIPEKFLPRVELRPVWAKENWRVALVVDPKGADPAAEPVELARRERVTLANARLVLGLGHDGVDPYHHKVLVLADGQEIESTQNGSPNSGAKPGVQGEFDSREYSLASVVGRDATLTLRLERTEKRPERAAGMLWQPVVFSPLIEGLPASLEPLRPDVSLATLTPEGDDANLKLLAGQTSDGKPLAVRGYRLTDGFAVPTGTSLTYKLDPSHTRFIAVLGLAGGWQGAGPYSILLDGQPHWKFARNFDRNEPALQIDLPIPAGHKTITLKVEGRESQAAWGNAGFLTD